MDDRWGSLVEGAWAMMVDRQSNTFSKFGLDYSMQYNWNVDRAELLFLKKGAPVVRAEIQLVGSIAGSPRTWLWSWANDSAPRCVTRRLAEIQQFGREQSLPKLTTPTWAIEYEEEGYDLMMVSASIINSESFFYCNTNGSDLFFITTHVEKTF